MHDVTSYGEPERLEILDARGRDLVGLWRNVLVVAIRALPEADQLHRIHEIQRDVAARFPRGFAALAILPVLSPRPLSKEMREAAELVTGDAPPELLAVAEVIEGRGFVAAAIRSIATGLILVTRPRWPMRIFASVEPAAAWVSAWVEGEGRPTATRRLTEAIRHTLV
jgi:hypothetical protein